MFDEMSNKKPKLLAGETSGVGGGDAAMALADRLSSLPDALLHHIMSFLRAWEVVQTCVLSRRWRHLWASAPCIDIRVWRLGRHQPPPYLFSRFVYQFLLEREESAPVDTLRLLSGPMYDKNQYKDEYDDDEEDDYSSGDVDIWIRAAIERRARFIQLAAHPKDEAFSDLERVNIISCHLKHLKLSGSSLGDRTLKHLSSQCPSLEVLDLKNCLLHGFDPKISSTSLKNLSIVECRIMEDFTIAAPNLVSLRCVTPHHRAPLFENVWSITTAIIALDDSFLYVGYEYEFKDIDKNEIYGGSDSDSDCSIRDDHGYGNETRDADSDCDSSTSEYSEIANDHEDKQCGDYHGHGRKQNLEVIVEAITAIVAATELIVVKFLVATIFFAA